MHCPCHSVQQVAHPVVLLLRQRHSLSRFKIIRSRLSRRRFTSYHDLQCPEGESVQGFIAHPMVTRSLASPTAALMDRPHATVKACVMRPSSAAKSERLMTTRPRGSLLLSLCFTSRSCTEIMSHFLSKGPN